MPGGWPVTTPCGTERAKPPGDRALADLASRQHGIVTLAQLRSFGLGPSAVRNRAATGRLHRVHRGVYAVGHPVLGIEGRWLAAVLACGPDAVLSHCSAAALWGLRPTARTAIDVTAPGRPGSGRRGIDAHSAATVVPADRTTARGIPCTTVARTLLDLAESLDRRGLERAFDQAEVLHVLDLLALQDVLDRAAGRRGAALLASVLAEHRPGDTLTRSELEERFFAICRTAGIPSPRVNVPVGEADRAVEVDFCWPDHRLIVETDGHATHGTRTAFERDRSRDRRLLVAGWRVARFTWRQVTREPAEVADTLRALMGGN